MPLPMLLRGSVKEHSHWTRCTWTRLMAMMTCRSRCAAKVNIMADQAVSCS